jgi:hypothetical protein
MPSALGAHQAACLVTACGIIPASPPHMLGLLGDGTPFWRLLYFISIYAGFHPRRMVASATRAVDVDENEVFINVTPSSICQENAERDGIHRSAP